MSEYHRRSIESRLADLSAERIRTAAAAGALALLLSACGGGAGGVSSAPSGPTAAGGSAATAAPSSAPAAGQRSAATVRLTIPAPQKNPSARHGKYVSPSSAGIGINVYAAATLAGSVPSAITPLYSADLTATGAGAPCVPQTNGTKICTFAVSAPPGNDAIGIYLYDAPPVGGSFAAAKLLSAAQGLVTIRSNVANAVSATLEGVVNSITLFAGTKWSFNAATGGFESPLIMSAYDAGGNLIIPVSGENYAQSITLALTSNTAHVKLVQKGAGTPTPVTSLVINGPDAPTALTALTLQWDGTVLTGPIGIRASIPGVSTPAVVGSLNLPAPSATSNIAFTIVSNLATIAVAANPNTYTSLPTTNYYETLTPDSATQTFPGKYYGLPAFMQYSIDKAGAPSATDSGNYAAVAFAGTALAMAYESATLQTSCVTDSFGVSFCNSVYLPYVEIDTQDAVGTVFSDFSSSNATYSDLCDVRGLAADGLGNLAVLGTPGCGTNRPIALLSNVRRTASQRVRPPATLRPPSGTRKKRNESPFTLEFIPQNATQVGRATPLASIGVGADAIGLTADGAGNIYVGHAGGTIDKYLNGNITASTTGPDSTLTLGSAGFPGSAVAVAASATGTVAELIFDGTSTYRVSIAAGGSSTETKSFLVDTAIAGSTITGMAFDAAGNIWIASRCKVIAFTPAGYLAFSGIPPFGAAGIAAPFNPTLLNFTGTYNLNG